MTAHDVVLARAKTRYTQEALDTFAELDIRPGTTRPKVPHARCEGAGSKGDGTILYRGVFQPCRDPVTHPPWIHKLLLSVFDFRWSPFEDGTSRH
jgi:hypothetical protein